jgi:hypothetical protein
MAASPGQSRPRNLRLLFAWLCTALVVGVYFSLPDGDDALGADASGASATEAPAPGRIEVVAVSPADPTPGSAVTVQFAGATHPPLVDASIGKTTLPVLSRHDDALVVRLPSTLPPGHLKLRVSDGAERSKPTIYGSSPRTGANPSAASWAVSPC